MSDHSPIYYTVRTTVRGIMAATFFYGATILAQLAGGTPT